MELTPEQLASEFSKVLREWLTPEQMQEVNRRNREGPYQELCCSSGDFCDSNMAMLQAIQNVTGKSEDDAFDWAMGDEGTSMWNRAWKIAKQRGFAL